MYEPSFSVPQNPAALSQFVAMELQRLALALSSAGKVVPLTSDQLASPSAAVLADLNAIYRLNVSPYTRYYSDGADLVQVPDASSSLANGDAGGLVVANNGATLAPKVGMRFTSDTGSTADSDPGAGLLKWNHATQSSATVLYVDIAETGGVDISDRIKLLSQGCILRIEQEDDSTRWQEWLLQGVVAASGYYKFSVIGVEFGSAIVDDKLIRVFVSGVSQGYLGGLSGDVTAVTYNSDGSVNAITIGGLTWTCGYNSNGTLATETITLTGADLVRTYAYDANGRYTGVSGAVERSGGIEMTWAQAKDLKTVIQSGSDSVEANGVRIFVTDIGSLVDSGGTKVPGASLEWRSTSATTGYWHAPGGVPYVNFTDSSAHASASESAALKTLTIPAVLLGPYGYVEIEHASDWGTTDVGTKQARAKVNGTSVHAIAASATGSSSKLGRVRVYNRGSVSSQFYVNAALANSGYGDSSSQFSTLSVNTDTTDLSITFTQENSSASDSTKFIYVSAVVRHSQ
jgi:hypothetical protein